MRAEYGKQIVVSLSRQLVDASGKGWDQKTPRHCLGSAETMTFNSLLSNYDVVSIFDTTIQYNAKKYF